MVDPDGRPTGQFEDTTPAQSETYWGLIKKGIFDPNAPPGSPKRPMAIPSDGRMPIHGGDWYVQRDDGALKQYVDPDTLEHTAEAAALRYAVPVVGDWIQRRYFPDPRLDAFQDGAWDGVTLGTGKYAASFFDAAPALLTGNFNETYQRDLAGREALDRQERQRYPWFHFAGEAAGGVAPMLLTDGLAAPVREGVLGWRALQGAGDLSRIARAAAPAVVDMAAQGTANAVHAAADTQGDLTQKAKALPGGFVAGALPAGAAHSAGALLDLGASRLLNARYEPQRLATYSDDVLPKPGEATSPAVDSPLPAPSEDPPPSTTPPSLHGDQPSLLQSLKKKSLRLLYLGRTPSKYSAVGNKVVNRMRTENKIFGEGPLLRGNPNNLHIINDDNSLTFIDHNVDMAHKQAAVSWWNSVGRQFGARSRQAREFMLDDSNYELQHRTQNRSEGGAMTERYMPPIGLSDPPPPGIFP